MINLTIRFCGVIDEVMTSKVLYLSTSNISAMEEFKSWIRYYNRGSFDENGDIICSSLGVFIAYQKKALLLGLLPEIPLNEIRTRYK